MALWDRRSVLKGLGAQIVHCLTATSVTALMEMLGNGSRTWPLDWRL